MSKGKMAAYISVIIGSCMVSLAVLSVYIFKADALQYDVKEDNPVLIADAKAEYLGVDEGIAYYDITLTTENRSNFGRHGCDFYFGIETADEEYYELNRKTRFAGFNELYDDFYIPAGKQCNIIRRIEVEEGAENICLSWLTGDEDESDELTFRLPEK